VREQRQQQEREAAKVDPRGAALHRMRRLEVTECPILPFMERLLTVPRKLDA